MGFDVAGYLQSYSLKDWIRIIVYVGGYMLIRPYLMKLGAKIQEREHRKSLLEGEVDGTLDPEMTHGTKPKEHGEFDTDDEEEEENPDAEFRWGYSARRRIRKQREEYFKNQDKSPLDAYADDDEDIEEHLED
ncbi:protein trafficking protein Pga2 [Schizosaccharomyces pombe]|uniref:PGA2-homolog C27.01c n=1 Tax=Schizosaccharomyces pombe (strain 972 / ATCC 24843) TaxID=284812 RepID=PGA2_SCHPO|nr:putative protein trafficking protein Pga2 [Schizosaccharomyces pombe]Q9P6S6.1 RecName: Full=PGA2-homolog C27.01c [Schizosaccharomyces pombe 972h-]CAB89001.1 protein trafficking protein Pga2 (predicted) [Schizosaccharomyces pombe]|eukprot:NP_595656.1 putative protein trafficking protein Pga2 [Schizosaccharomyces pombe]